MAQYRLSVSIAKRSSGRSATAMAAYRAGAVMHDRRTGETFDYTRKTGVLYEGVITPAGAPDWARDRQELWNRSEARHTREKAIIAREIQLSLPHELDNRQRRELTTSFARFLAERYNVAVDTCLHAPSRDGDERNHHAHLMICTRPFDETKAHGLGNNIRAFDAVSCQRQKQGNEVETWRAVWAQQLNDALQRAEVRTADGVIVTVDHRSYERQGIDQEPTLKEGPAATAMKRRGGYPERVEINAEIKARNQERAQLEREVEALNEELQGWKRRAEHMTASQVQTALTASNDNQPDPQHDHESLMSDQEQAERERINEALQRIRSVPSPSSNLAMEL